MKKIIYNITIGCMMISLALSSCTKDFQELNTDPNNIGIAQPGQLLAPAIVGVLTTNLIRNRSFNNELMQVTVDPGDAEGRIFRYDIRANVSNPLYNEWYNELTNIKDIYRLASDSTSPLYSRNYMAVSLILQVWVHSLLTDTFGDVPYFQSNKGKDSLVFEPAFDPQREIYFDMFNKLEQANALLAATYPAIENLQANYDPVYNGVRGDWRRFGNSLYLRLLMRLSGKAEVADVVRAKIKEIVDISPDTYPRISNNIQSANVTWTGTAPYISPLGAVRPTDFDGPRIASFFINNLNTWQDPRISLAPAYAIGGRNRWGIAGVSGNLIGVPSGYPPGTNLPTASYFYSMTSGGLSLQNDSASGILMNFAEQQFILAEAAAKGYITTGTAASYYNSGAEASITYWVPQWTTTIDPQTNLPNNIVTYLTANDIQWMEGETLDEKMEKIHLQKYYALFMVDLEQWFEYRRTGHPILPNGGGLQNGGVMPARLNYPVYLQSVNPTNYKIAVERQGPDVISTLVWWQKP